MCKTKSRLGSSAVRGREAIVYNGCAEQIMEKCTRPAVYCHSLHRRGFSVGNLYFCMNLFTGPVKLNLMVLKLFANCGK